MLWGLKSNQTSLGVLHYSSLAVSLSGKIDLKFSYRPRGQQVSPIPLVLSRYDFYSLPLFIPLPAPITFHFLSPHLYPPSDGLLGDTVTDARPVRSYRA